MMYAVFMRTAKLRIMAPNAWFMDFESAQDYAEYLNTCGKDALVVEQPDLRLEGEETEPEGWPKM